MNPFNLDDVSPRYVETKEKIILFELYLDKVIDLRFLTGMVTGTLEMDKHFLPEAYLGSQEIFP